jgi:hypothetical protein
MVPDDFGDLNLEEMDNLSINEEGQQQQNELANGASAATTAADNEIASAGRTVPRLLEETEADRPVRPPSRRGSINYDETAKFPYVDPFDAMTTPEATSEFQPRDARNVLTAVEFNPRDTSNTMSSVDSCNALKAVNEFTSMAINHRNAFTDSDESKFSSASNNTLLAAAAVSEFQPGRSLGITDPMSNNTRDTISSYANDTMPPPNTRCAMIISAARARRHLNYTINTPESLTVSSAGQAVCEDIGRRHGLQAHTVPPPPIRFRHGRRLHSHPMLSRHGGTMHSPSQLYAVMAQDEEASRKRMRRMEMRERMEVMIRERMRLSRLRINVLLRENRGNHREVQNGLPNSFYFLLHTLHFLTLLFLI